MAEPQKFEIPVFSDDKQAKKKESEEDESGKDAASKKPEDEKEGEELVCPSGLFDGACLML